MANEPFQTRLHDDRAEQVHEYMEGRRISKAEAVRRLIVKGLEAHHKDQEADEEPEADEEQEVDEDRRDRFQVLARLADRTLGFSVLFLFIGWLVPLLGYASVAYTDLTIGTFGEVVIWGTAGLLVLVGFAMFVLGASAAVAMLAVYGIEAGWFSRRLGAVIPTPEGTA
jgi:hypothetical protein